MDKSQPLVSDITSVNGKLKTLEVVVQAYGFNSTPYKHEIHVPLILNGYVSFDVRTDSNWTNFNLQVSHFNIILK